MQHMLGPRKKRKDEHGQFMKFLSAHHACIAAVLFQAWWVPGLLEPAEKTTMGEPLGISIRHAITGELLCQWASSEVGELRVWELKRLLCQVTASEEYFAWQLHDDKCLLRDNSFVSDLAQHGARALLVCHQKAAAVTDPG